MQIVFLLEMSNPTLLEKIRKITNLSSAEFAHSEPILTLN